MPRPLIRVSHTYPYGEVLLDVWVVRHYDGETRGLDGQALRWCTQEELAEAALLPADRPIVALLRLPEGLTRMLTPDYRVIDTRGATIIDPIFKSRGLICDAEGATATDADFVVMRSLPEERELAGLCARVPVPVYVPDMEVERAWEFGASGGISKVTGMFARTYGHRVGCENQA